MRLLDVSAADLNAALAKLRDSGGLGDHKSVVLASDAFLDAIPDGAVLVAVTERDLDDGMSSVYDEARRALALKADA